jgi:phenylpyruvate tautomerase PptA (4-oxalocrotonate tautomerase family)
MMPIANLKISVGLVDEQRKGEPISLIADVLAKFFGEPSRATA